MIDPFPKLAKLKELYPEDIELIERDEARMSDLLRKQDYTQQPMTQELLALCRKDILSMQKLLATTRDLAEEVRRDAWHIIDARLWFVKMVAKDYTSEIEQMERELESELAR